ncbi:nuclear transport factor 2 family protein [Streptomyces sp. ICN988]|uniref:nuclear transport factor 2 family protein n=1 Tax=unclassified Streptomyces TaxID=2593676 RepID=UPI0021E44FD4|nr:nuclear transport factor 2 family protein [Streptomyces sp. ICN988]MCV2460092.1 nuclear transport factor 2 family protein [Streptomyces sp. ICN988]
MIRPDVAEWNSSSQPLTATVLRLTFPFPSKGNSALPENGRRTALDLIWGAMSQLTNEPGTEETASADPVHTVRAYYRLVDSGDVPGLVRLFAPDAEYHRPGYDKLTGRAELERFYREDRVIADGTHRLSKIVSQGRDVAVHGTFEGVLHDGTKTSVRFADFFSVNKSGTFSLRETFFYAPLV